MQPQSNGRRSILALIMGLAVCLPATYASGQSLFGNSRSSGSNRPSATGSLFSGSIGVSPSPASNPAPATGQSFVGRSNQGFVGGRGSSAAPQGDSAAPRRPDSSRRSESSRRQATGSGSSATATAAESRRATGPGRRTLIPRHRIAFKFTARETSEIGTSLRLQLANLAARNPDFAEVRVELDAAGTVQLRGQVPSEATRKLAAILVRLEPGVRKVHNELTIAPEGN